MRNSQPLIQSGLKVLRCLFSIILKIKKQLKNIHVEAETDGVAVTIDGEQQFLEVKIDESAMGDAKKLGKAFVDAANKAVKKSQTIGAEKMKDVMGGMGGLFG